MPPLINIKATTIKYYKYIITIPRGRPKSKITDKTKLKMSVCYDFQRQVNHCCLYHFILFILSFFYIYILYIYLLFILYIYFIYIYIYSSIYIFYIYISSQAWLSIKRIQKFVKQTLCFLFYWYIYIYIFINQLINNCKCITVHNM